tara:strand:- start:281 stop:616 length:336 start_codon:yes stop_codon:yes gene_type:complete
MEAKFGKGFVYCLILFAEHCERMNSLRELDEERAVDRWFESANDHLVDLDIPTSLQGTDLGVKITEFQRHCFNSQYGGQADYMEAIALLEELCMLIDQQVFGVTTVKSRWD